MGPFMVEIVFCRVTRRGRKKKSGMNKLARENMRNDGPMQSFIPQDDMIKVTLDLSGKEDRTEKQSADQIFNIICRLLVTKSILTLSN
jgi:hypothetical protein